MPAITFSGHILPAGRNITFHDLPNMTIENGDLKITVTTKIERGAVRTDCVLNRELQGDELVRLYVRVYEVSRTTMDVFAFATGLGYSLVLDSYTNAAGTTELVIENPALRRFCKSFDLDNPSFSSTLLMFLEDPYLGWALKDLIEANTEPNHASITCARSVESLRTIMTGLEMPRARAWGVFQNNLRISRQFRELITNTSKGPRHGDRSPIAGVTTIEVTTRAWQIMDRFIEYRRRGDQPLPEADFPLL